MRKKLNIDLNTFVVISVGELNDNKNHQVMIRAIAKISDVSNRPNFINGHDVAHTNNDVVYIIVGRGTFENHLKRLAVQLGMSDRVIFTD